MEIKGTLKGRYGRVPASCSTEHLRAKVAARLQVWVCQVMPAIPQQTQKPGQHTHTHTLTQQLLL